jgi:hypothetical protein
MKKHIFVKIVLISLVSYLFCSCNKSPKIEIKRYERDFMAIDTNNIEKTLLNLENVYYPFLEGIVIDSTTVSQIKNFITDTTAIAMLGEINTVYPNLTNIEKTLSKALYRYKSTFYNDSVLPEVYSFLSFLDYDGRIVFGNDFLLIALDMYLGADCRFYKESGLPEYMIRRLSSDFLPSDAMRAVAYYESNGVPKNFMDNLIFQGKIVYFLNEVLGEKFLAENLGFTKKDLNYCDKYAEEMWAYFVTQQLFFTENFFEIRKFFGESPTINIFPDSPGRVGWYFGYKIVEKYMKNEKVSLPALMKNDDFREIFDKSKYRP